MEIWIIRLKHTFMTVLLDPKTAISSMLTHKAAIQPEYAASGSFGCDPLCWPFDSTLFNLSTVF
jgi:hypothetical protein